MSKILSFLFTTGAVLSGILVITAKNTVIAVVFLISLFINIAGYLILSGIVFVGLSYIIIYIGAITVLFLFIIMMINIRLVDILELGSEYTKNLPLAILLGILFIFEIFSFLPFTFNNIFLLFLPLNILSDLNNTLFTLTGSNPIDLYIYFKAFATQTSGIMNYSFFSIDSFILNFSQIESLGLVLYTQCSSWLLECSLILMLGMISAIFLSTTHSQSASASVPHAADYEK